MNGKLTAQPLAELIREIASKALSGALRLEYERAKTVAYFESGRIVFAASNLRTLRLREYLKKKGVVSEEEFSGLENPGADLSLASSLCANGKLSQGDFDSLLATLVADVLRVPLLWTDGTWEFDERARLDNPVRVKIDPTRLLKEAAQRLPVGFVSFRFRNPNETISRSTAGATTNNLLPAESFILSRLDKPTKLEELVAVSGMGEQDAHRAIYGLALSGLVHREYWQNAFRTEPAKTGTSKKQIVVPTLPETPATKPKVADRWSQVKDEGDLEEFLGRLGAANNFYEVMDVPPAARGDEIKEAYYSLARRYHPDRVHLKSGTRLYNQISSAFARITQAYETLMDDKARSTYDASLARARQFAKSAPQTDKAGHVANSTDVLEPEIDSSESEFGQAERYFREGFGCLQQGQINAAITHLAAASRLSPHEPRYRAYYGRALAANEQSRRVAESEIQAAVKLEPSNSLYRIMLAELYVDLKFHRRAQTELDRALELDPKNASALNLLRKLAKLRKAEGKERS